MLKQRYRDITDKDEAVNILIIVATAQQGQQQHPAFFTVLRHYDQPSSQAVIILRTRVIGHRRHQPKKPSAQEFVDIIKFEEFVDIIKFFGQPKFSHQYQVTERIIKSYYHETYFVKPFKSFDIKYSSLSVIPLHY